MTKEEIKKITITDKIGDIANKLMMEYSENLHEVFIINQFEAKVLDFLEELGLDPNTELTGKLPVEDTSADTQISHTDEPG